MQKGCAVTTNNGIKFVVFRIHFFVYYAKLFDLSNFICYNLLIKIIGVFNMKIKGLKRKHIVTVRLSDGDYFVLNFLCEKYRLSQSKLLRILLNCRSLDSVNFPDYENK